LGVIRGVEKSVGKGQGRGIKGEWEIVGGDWVIWWVGWWVRGVGAKVV